MIREIQIAHDDQLEDAVEKFEEFLEKEGYCVLRRDLDGEVVLKIQCKDDETMKG